MFSFTAVGMELFEAEFEILVITIKIYKAYDNNLKYILEIL